MLSLVLAILFTPASFALDEAQCERVQSSLQSIEQNLLSKQIPQCASLTPESVNLAVPMTSADQQVFEFFRCGNVATLDMALAQIEMGLVVSDGLRDLRAQVVATQQTLAADTQFNASEVASAVQMTRDITLGATIESLLNLEQLPTLFTDSTSSAQWEPKLRTFCSSAPQNTSEFCAMITTFTGPQGALQSSELAAFLDQLRPLLAANSNSLSAEQRTSLLDSLKVRVGTEVKTMSELRVLAEQNGFTNLQQLATATTLTSQQVRFLRTANLSVPTTNPLTRALAERLNRSQQRSVLQNALTQARETANDAVERSLARVKARWSSLYLHKGGNPQSIPCLNSATVSAMRTCMMNDWRERPSTDNAQVVLYNTLLTALNTANETSTKVTACFNNDTVRTWLQNPTTTPPACASQTGSDIADVERRRQILLAIRERLRAQEDQALRFRRFAYDKAIECADSSRIFSSRVHDPINYCLSSGGSTSFGPVLELATSSLAFVHEGMDSNTVFDKDRDCPPGQQNEYAALCEIAHARPAEESGSTEPYRGSPQTADTLTAPARRSDPLLADMLGGVVQDLGNQYLRNRFGQPQQQIYQFPRSPYMQMPYSQPVSLSMSSFVIANARAYGGFGQYYQCTTCGFGSGPSAFNQRWGVGGFSASSSSTGTLAASGLTSRFFSPAGTFNFQ
jgi:hypothetical protein